MNQKSVEITDKYLSYGLVEVGIFLIDLDSLDVNGLEVIEIIRANKKVASIPILGMSRHADIRMLKQAVSIGCNDFMIKPFDSDTVVQKVSVLLGDKHKERYSENVILDMTNVEKVDSKLIWHQDLEIGQAEVDKEHRMLVDQYKHLYELMKTGSGHKFYKELLLFLTKYVENHFSHEEILHEEHNYPLAAEHKMIHESFKKSVKKLYMDGYKKDISDENLIYLSVFIRNWLVQHILVEDQKFGRFLSK